MNLTEKLLLGILFASSLTFVVIADEENVSTNGTNPGSESEPEQSERITGGGPVRIFDAAFVVSLQNRGQHICGGSIIDPDTILTAAFCIRGKRTRDLSIRAGSSNHNRGGIVVGVRNAVPHYNHSTGGVDNDFAIVKLDRPLILNSGLRSVPLAGNDFIQDRTVGTVFGWGPETPFDPTLSPALRGVDVDIFSTSTCASRFHPDLITKRLFCAGAIRGGRDACTKDEGGPLIYRGILVGVMSQSVGCGFPDSPTIYGKVSAVYQWIVSQL